ncbi:MAG: prepilin-type N-terminal cleavage/methylation domain-containing protein [Syntrophales bacterium LBB04]|nr:prepilin-type N-terminal cleavage/methylation domain-containing protein [Syntrophales bacterium LBB04]
MLHDHNRAVRGFTLIELLIGVALSGIVVLALYGLLTSQHRVYVVQDDISEMHQNLRLAMERISRDLTMAGFGKPSRLGTSTWPQLNGISGLDFSIKVTGGKTLDIIGCLDPADGHAVGALSLGATTITLQSGEGSSFNTTTKSDISIGGKENAKIVSIAGDTLTIDTNPILSVNQGLTHAYPAGISIYAVKYVTYSVDTSDPNAPVLKIDEHRGAGRQSVAQYIEVEDVTVTGNALDLTLIGRTRNPDRTTNRYTRVQIQNKVFLRNLPKIPT